jgi:hypothetical protein
LNVVAAAGRNAADHHRVSRRCVQTPQRVGRRGYLLARRQSSERIAAASQPRANLQEASRARKGADAKVERNREDACAHAHAGQRDSYGARLRLLRAAAQAVPQRKLEVIASIGWRAAIVQAALIGKGCGLRSRCAASSNANVASKSVDPVKLVLGFLFDRIMRPPD